MSRPIFDNKVIIIETLSGMELFKGKINNGHIKGYVEPELVNHPGWRSRLTIGLVDLHSNSFLVPIDVNERVIFILIFKHKISQLKNLNSYIYLKMLKLTKYTISYNTSVIENILTLELL